MSNIFELFSKIKSTENTATGAVSFIAVGLGNPGDKYAGTRHNAGFMAIDAIAKEKNVKLDRAQFKSLTAKCEINGKSVLLMKPATYMNLSGQAVIEALNFYKLTPKDIVVFSDDVNLELGKLRIRQGGSDGGQKGLRSIIELLGSDDFCRVRIGVGSKPHPDYDMADWVLSRFTAQEMEKINVACERCRDALPYISVGDIQKAMGLYNG